MLIIVSDMAVDLLMDALTDIILSVLTDIGVGELAGVNANVFAGVMSAFDFVMSGPSKKLCCSAAFDFRSMAAFLDCASVLHV